MSISLDELKRFERTAAINEIAMMFGRYATLMDQMDVMGVYEELFATGDPEVSVEFETNGTYVGPDHCRIFMQDLHRKYNDSRTKRGWMDFLDGGTPQIVLSKDGQRAEALWTLISPKAKQATADPDFSARQKLTAFWHCGKMHWKLKKIDGEWKVLNFHLLTFFTSEYHTSWVTRQECFRERPLWALPPDKKARFYVYHPDQVYVQGGQYTWGPYLPEDGSF